MMAGLLPAPAATQTSAEGLDAASFMVGCWARRPDTRSGLREIYAPAAANMMTGLSQFWREGEIVDFECHRLEASPRGPLLTPHPQGVASVTFSPV